MTRKKKTRSLKRIHSVKTGNTSKLKRAGDTDRQSSNLKTKNKPKSVYQKFLDKNPDAIEKQAQPKQPATENKNTPKKGPTEGKGNLKKESQKPKTDKASQKPEKDSNSEKEPDLLSQLDNKNFNDFY